jgi:hypothetical protein
LHRFAMPQGSSSSQLLVGSAHLGQEAREHYRKHLQVT